MRDDSAASGTAGPTLGVEASRGPSVLCRRDFFYGAILLLVWLSVSIPRLSGPIDLRWDASTYYVLGTALAEGKGYRLLNEPGEIQAVQYPPLLPLFVAAHQWLMGTNDYFKVGSQLRISYFLLSGLYLVTIYVLARRFLSPLFALSVGAMTALSFYSFLHPSDTLYAELPFGLVSMLFLLFHQREDGPLRVILTGFLGAAAYLLRTAGIALLVAWVGESVIRRRFRQAALRIVISAIPIVIWQAHIWRVAGSEEYRNPVYPYQRAPYYYSNVTYGENSKLADSFRPELGRLRYDNLIRRIASNVAAVPLGLGESALVDSGFGIPGHWHKSSYLLKGCVIIAGVAAVAGCVLVATGPEWFMSLYFALMVGLVTLTPWQSQFWRYFAPVTPITLIFLILVLLGIRRWLNERSAQWARLRVGTLVVAPPIIGILVIQAVVAIYFLRSLRPISYYDASGRERSLRLLTYDSAWHSTDSAFEWIRRRAPANAILATAVPHFAYLRTGHKAVLPPFEIDPSVASSLLEQVPVNYIVLDRLHDPGISERYAAPVVAQNPRNWRLVFTAPDKKTRVYERAQ